MVDGLVAREYGIYLLDADGDTVHRSLAEATNGMLYEYVPNHRAVGATDRVLLVRTDELTGAPDDAAVVFEARRSGASNKIDVEPQPVVEPVE